MDSPFADLVVVADWMQQTREHLDVSMVPPELFDPLTINQQHLARLRSVEAVAKESLATLKSVDGTVKENLPIVPVGMSSVPPRSTWTAHVEQLKLITERLTETATFFTAHAKAVMPVSECATLLRASV